MGKNKIRALLIRNPRGYSLIEVVVAIGVFAIGALTVSNLLLASFQNNRAGDKITQATMLAETKMEDLKSVSDITLLADEVESDIDQNGQPGGIYTRTSRITNTFGVNFSRQIEVTVQWISKGRMRRVVLTSITQGNGI